jgi:predicted N-acetyltransferase YhbS
VNIRDYRAADEPRVLDLLQAAFGDWPGPRVAAGEKPADFFRWKHRDNPHGASFIVLAEEDDELIGMRAYMRWPLTANGTRVDAVQAVDLATHPDHRGRGVNSQLTKHAMSALKPTTAFAFGLPNDMSRSQSSKVGWRPVGELPIWVRVTRPARVLRGLHTARSSPPPAEPLAIDAPPATDCLDAGPLREADNNRFATQADADYLRWRYAPLLADYRAVSAPDGLAIFRLTQRGRLREGTICELFAPDRQTAARLLKAIAAAAPFDYLAANAPQPRFVRSPTGHRALGVTPYQDGTEPDPTSIGSWALTLGDLERLELC